MQIQKKNATIGADDAKSKIGITKVAVPDIKQAINAAKEMRKKKKQTQKQDEDWCGC